jgi:aldose 1-epimerase
MYINKKPFGYIDYKEVLNYEFTTNSGFKVEISPFGATIVNVESEDKNGKFESVCLGFDQVEDYLKHASSYFGCIVGRVAGRIENGEFTLDGAKYSLALNNKPNTLHGGIKGFNQKLFHVKDIILHDEEASIVLTYTSLDNEENFPGNLSLEVTYVIKDHSLTLDIKATTDKTTIVDITNHVGFNLSGNVKDSIANHLLSIDADYYSPLNENYIPKTLKDVTNTVFDFRKPKYIKEALTSNDEQIIKGKGIDHPFRLNHTSKPDITLYDPSSGRLLEINTTQVAVVAYSGNYLNEKLTMRNKQKGFKNAMICLETQSLPNAINNPLFPSIILNKNDVYHQTTTYNFKVKY